MDKKYREIFEVVKADIDKVNENLACNFDVNSQLNKELQNFLQSPSKRIRSLVSILFLRASKMYLLPSHYELLATVELVHNASLIHDDVIDESKIRRDEKSFNEKFGNKLAVISGDYILGVALEKLVKIGDSKVTEIFAKTLQTMCKGEVNQYLNLFKKTDIDTYIDKSLQKTASLFECALQSSVVLAQEEYTEQMSEFATNFGLAFQIADDLKNALSNSKTDENSGIYNAPLILSENLDDGIEKTKVLLENYVNCAKHCLNDLSDSIYKRTLIELLELIKNV